MKLTIFFGLILSSLAFSAPPSESADRAVRTQLCDYWNYNFEVREYTCRFLGQRVNLVEARDYEQTISRLESRIEELEKRLK